MKVKEKLTGRTMEVAAHEKKKLEILLYSGWVVVDETTPTPVAPPVVAKVETDIPVVVQPIVEPAIPDEPVPVELEMEPEPVLVGEIVDDENEKESLPLPATEPRKARTLAPKPKKTLKLPDGNA